MIRSGMGTTVVAAALACALGCGGSSSSGGVASCSLSNSLGAETETLMLCEEATGVQASQIQQACSASSVADAGIGVRALYRNGPCSHEGALGGCQVTSGGTTETAWYYHNGPLTSADVQTLCSGIGATFIAP